MTDSNRPGVLCIGSNIESEMALSSLVDAGVNVVGLVSGLMQAERRGSDYRDLEYLASNHGFAFHRTDNANSAETKAFVKSLNPDFVFILGWSQILDSEFIALAGRNIFGSHPSVLPYGAGRAPVPWTVLEGLARSAVTIFEVVAEVDAGRILHQEYFDIPAKANSREVYALVAQSLGKAFVAVYRAACEDRLEFKKQDMSLRTVRARRTPVDGYVDFHCDAEAVACLVRAATDPFPGAFSYYNDNKLIIWECVEVVNTSHKGVVGQILQKRQDGILVQCKDVPLLLTDITDEYGRTVSPAYFQLGERFGYVSGYEINKLKSEIAEIRRLLEKYEISRE